MMTKLQQMHICQNSLNYILKIHVSHFIIPQKGGKYYEKDKIRFKKIRCSIYRKQETHLKGINLNIYCNSNNKDTSGFSCVEKFILYFRQKVLLAQISTSFLIIFWYMQTRKLRMIFSQNSQKLKTQSHSEADKPGQKVKVNNV